MKYPRRSIASPQTRKRSDLGGPDPHASSDVQYPVVVTGERHGGFPGPEEFEGGEMKGVELRQRRSFEAVSMAVQSGVRPSVR